MCAIRVPVFVSYISKKRVAPPPHHHISPPSHIHLQDLTSYQINHHLLIPLWIFIPQLPIKTIITIINCSNNFILKLSIKTDNWRWREVYITSIATQLTRSLHPLLSSKTTLPIIFFSVCTTTIDIIITQKTITNTAVSASSCAIL